MAKSLKQSTRQNSKKKTVPKSSKPKVQSSSVVDDCQVIHHSPIQIRQLANKFDNLPLIFVDIFKKENKPSEFHHRLFIRMRLALCFENLQERQYC